MVGHFFIMPNRKILKLWRLWRKLWRFMKKILGHFLALFGSEKGASWFQTFKHSGFDIKNSKNQNSNWNKSEKQRARIFLLETVYPRKKNEGWGELFHILQQAAQLFIGMISLILNFKYDVKLYSLRISPLFHLSNMPRPPVKK